MSWTNLIWVLLYLAVGWIFTEVYDLDGGIWGLLVFLLWPVIVVSFCIIIVLLFLFGLVLTVEEIGYGLFHRRKDEL